MGKLRKLRRAAIRDRRDNRTYLIVSVAPLVRVEITGCWYCAGQEWVCGVCAAKAEKARKRLSKRKLETEATCK